MSIELNHTIVRVRDRSASAAFYREILGLPDHGTYGPFEVLRLDNAAALDLLEEQGDIASQHYAFLVSDDEFDAVFDRIRARGLTYWADPGRRKQGQTNDLDGGRGVYWEDLDGHLLEMITRPYGSGS